MSEAAGTDIDGISDGITVTPETFTLVDYDAVAIAKVATELCQEIGLSTAGMRIEIDETTPLGRAHVASIDPPVLAVESGAFEHLHQPRQFNPDRAADVLGRLFYRLHDRLDPAFGEPPPDDELPLDHSTAWDVYAVGRFGRAGHPVQRQRRLYQFRLRHGFTDAVDAIFAQLWSTDGLTWDRLTALSDQAAAVTR